MMHYVYVLQSEIDNKYYIGQTNNLERRFEEHCLGKVLSTKGRRPLRLIFFEAFLNLKDALRREGYFKTTAGKRALKIMLREYRNS